MNVLITSAAAKVLLVRAFQRAVGGRGGRVVACDIAADSAALFAADAGVLVPRLSDPGFRAAFLGLCAGHAIDLVVPTRDGELAALAALAPELAARGTRVLVAAPETLRLCADKPAFAGFCRDHGFPVAPVLSPDEEPAFPVFVRPASGAGAVGAHRIDDRAAWEALGERRRDHIIQPVITAPEYTIDTLMDFEGGPVQAVARRRLAIRAGEATKSQVENLPALSEMALALCARLGCVGHNIVQAFYRPEEGPLFIEVNPRFGGASNLSLVAGLASPERLFQLLAGEAEAARQPRPIAFGLMMLRHSEDIFVEPAALAALENRA